MSFILMFKANAKTILLVEMEQLLNEFQYVVLDYVPFEI